MTVDGVRLEMPNNRNVMADDHFKHKKTCKKPSFLHVSDELQLKALKSFKQTYFQSLSNQLWFQTVCLFSVDVQVNKSVLLYH